MHKTALPADYFGNDGIIVIDGMIMAETNIHRPGQATDIVRRLQDRIGQIRRKQELTSRRAITPNFDLTCPSFLA